ncbi:MAG: hypothetical protein R3E95_16635 [Thiolinea sp.]
MSIPAIIYTIAAIALLVMIALRPAPVMEPDTQSTAQPAASATVHQTPETDSDISVTMDPAPNTETTETPLETDNYSESLMEENAQPATEPNPQENETAN